MTRATMQMAQDYLERIKELEKENEELRNNGFTVSAMTEQQLKVALEKGEQLEKENTELKRLLDCSNCCELDEDECEVCAEGGHFKCKGKSQLAQAKSYIKYFVGILKNLGADKEELVIDAEQFLK